MAAPWADRAAHTASPLHLARELVRADTDIDIAKRTFHWDHARSLEAYRDRIQGWRFATVRGQQPNNLLVCPSCDRVQQLLPGKVRCFCCEHQWVTEGDD